MNGARDISTGQFGFLTGGGNVGTLIRTKDWSQSLPGAPQRWPQILKTTVGLVLDSHAPMLVLWGPELIQIYNDACAPIVGAEHPSALGAPAREAWPQSCDHVWPLALEVLEHGEPNCSQELVVLLNRRGCQEEAYFTLSLSPIRDVAGHIGGVLGVYNETTAEVLGQRRSQTLRALAAAGPVGCSTLEVLQLISRIFEHEPDIPFALFYQLAPERDSARLVACVGTTPDTPIAPSLIDAGQASRWPLFEADGDGKLMVVHNLDQRFGTAPTGPWAKPPASAALFGLPDGGRRWPTTVMVLGINPHRPFDDDYRGFFELATAQAASAIARAQESFSPLSATPEASHASAGEFSDHSQRLLIDELNHRVRNTLMVVQSIAAQTQRHSSSLESFGVAFEGRIQALADTHTLLTESGWKRSTLDAIVEQQVRPYVRDGKTFAARGPHLEIRAKPALAIGLIIHELATNARKHGALSRPTGSVEIAWEVSPQQGSWMLTLCWVESGGPSTQLPRSEGFGTKLVDFCVRHEFSGQVARQFRTTGLTCTLSIPIGQAGGPL